MASLSEAAARYLDDDPVLAELIEVLRELLGEEPDPEVLEGFLIVAPRFVNEFGNHRLWQLEDLFRTNSWAGREVLKESLRSTYRSVGGLSNFIERYPVSVIPPRPAFPLLRIVGLERIVDRVFRVLDSRAELGEPGLTARTIIERTDRLPRLPRQRWPVRRTKPRLHWCTDRTWSSLQETRERLQILEPWSDCRLRACLSARAVGRAAFVAFNGDVHDPENVELGFYRYYFEPLAQDHPPLLGGGVQIGLEGSPQVESLDHWDQVTGRWQVCWQRRADPSSA